MQRCSVNNFDTVLVKWLGIAFPLTVCYRTFDPYLLTYQQNIVHFLKVKKTVSETENCHCKFMFVDYFLVMNKKNGHCVFS